jgi:hypothetical protein
MLRRALRILTLSTAALLAAVFLLAVLLWLPPAAQPVAPVDTTDPAVAARLARTVGGAIHIHTTRSDGAGTPDEVAAAAARAHLQFVIFTDHGDGTRVPDPPQYRSGVLCLDGVEVSTSDGHVLGIGMGRSPYPLAGEARDVVEDIHRLGGISIAAHPGSRKAALRWRDWDAPVDGLEWINLDSEWRDETRTAIARAFAGYLLRAPQAVASLLDEPADVLARWDAMTARRPIVAVAGADAHARIGAARGDPAEGAALPLPSYEQTFRTVSNRVVLERPLSGQPANDAGMLLRALRGGHLFTAIDALAAPATLRLTAASGGFKGEQGDTVPFQNAAAGARIVVKKAGKVLREADGGSVTLDDVREPSAYRVEVHVAGAPGSPPVPWLVSNPVYLESDPRPITQIELPPPRETEAVGSPSEWHIEQSTSTSTLTTSPDGAVVEYALDEGPPRNQYVAAVLPVGGRLAGFSGVAFTASANGPSRLSVQIRRPHVDERWRRSIFVDSSPRLVRIPFDDFRPVRSDSAPHPDLATLDALMFVVDLTNAKPGSGGWFSIGGVRLER